jgi:hypothetical protein
VPAIQRLLEPLELTSRVQPQKWTASNPRTAQFPKAFQAIVAAKSEMANPEPIKRGNCLRAGPAEAALFLLSFPQALS